MPREVRETDDCLIFRCNEATTQSYSVSVTHRRAELPPKDVDIDVFVPDENPKLPREQIAAVRIGYRARHDDIVGVVCRWQHHRDGNAE
jgi:hypothetical protein